MEDDLPKGVTNLKGQKFGSLTPQYIVKIIPKEGAIWFCLCCCGGNHTVLATHLLRGRSHYCQACARAHRREQLRRARTNILRFDGISRKAQEESTDTLSESARPYFEEMIERRRRAGIKITPAILASCRNVAEIEARQALRHAA